MRKIRCVGVVQQKRDSAIERAIVFSDRLYLPKSRERSHKKLRNSLRTIDSLRMLQTPLAMTSTFVKRLA